MGPARCASTPEAATSVWTRHVLPPTGRAPAQGKGSVGLSVGWGTLSARGCSCEALLGQGLNPIRTPEQDLCAHRAACPPGVHLPAATRGSPHLGAIIYRTAVGGHCSWGMGHWAWERPESGETWTGVERVTHRVRGDTGIHADKQGTGPTQAQKCPQEPTQNPRTQTHMCTQAQNTFPPHSVWPQTLINIQRHGDPGQCAALQCLGKYPGAVTCPSSCHPPGGWVLDALGKTERVSLKPPHQCKSRL